MCCVFGCVDVFVLSSTTRFSLNSALNWDHGIWLAIAKGEYNNELGDEIFLAPRWTMADNAWEINWKMSWKCKRILVQCHDSSVRAEISEKLAEKSTSTICRVPIALETIHQVPVTIWHKSGCYILNIIISSLSFFPKNPLMTHY
jgi:hypothetical protein